MNVLLAVDESAAGSLAEELLQTLPLPDPSYVAVVAAVGGPSSAGVRKQLQQIASRQRRSGVEASTLSLTGDPVKSILKLAAELPADLVVVGVGSESEASSAMAAKLVQNCQCPVGIARKGRPLRRVLLATHQLDTANRCLDFLSQFPWVPNEVVVVPLVVLPDGSRRETEEARAQQLVKAVEKRLAEWSVACQPVFEPGQPASTILRIAQAQDVDLVVVGSRELSAPARLFLGSVSGQVMSGAGCNVLVVRGRVSARLPIEDVAAEELV